MINKDILKLDIYTRYMQDIQHFKYQHIDNIKKYIYIATRNST